MFAAGDTAQLRQVMDSYSSQAQRLQVSLYRISPAGSSHAVIALMRLAAQPLPHCLPDSAQQSNLLMAFGISLSFGSAAQLCLLI